MNDEQTVRELPRIVSELTDVEKRYDVATPSTSPIGTCSAPWRRPGSSALVLVLVEAV